MFFLLDYFLSAKEKRHIIFDDVILLLKLVFSCDVVCS